MTGLSDDNGSVPVTAEQQVMEGSQSSLNLRVSESQSELPPERVPDSQEGVSLHLHFTETQQVCPKFANKQQRFMCRGIQCLVVVWCALHFEEKDKVWVTRSQM